MNALDYFNARLEATISPMDYLKSIKAAPEMYFLVDVRNGPKDLRNITIKGAKIIPEQELKNRIGEIPKEKEIIVYCWDVWCNTATKSAKILLERDYRVKELAGGITAWQKMNFPISKLDNEQSDECGC